MRNRKRGSNLYRMLERDTGSQTATPGPNGVLSRLWRNILIERNVNGNMLNILLEKYVTNPRNHIRPNRKDQISARGNLMKEISRPQMTWKVFCKAMKFLNIAKMEVIIIATDLRGVKTEHSTTVLLSDGFTKGQIDELMDQDESREYVQPIDYLDGDQLTNVKTASEKETV